jgi:hypothetical protein
MGGLHDGQHGNIRETRGLIVVIAPDNVFAQSLVEFGGRGFGFFRLPGADEDGVAIIGPAQSKPGAFFARAAQDGDGGMSHGIS